MRVRGHVYKLTAILFFAVAALWLRTWVVTTTPRIQPRRAITLDDPPAALTSIGCAQLHVEASGLYRRYDDVPTTLQFCCDVPRGVIRMHAVDPAQERRVREDEGLRGLVALWCLDHGGPSPEHLRPTAEGYCAHERCARLEVLESGAAIRY